MALSSFDTEYIFAWWRGAWCPSKCSHCSGCYCRTDNLLKNAPHTAQAVLADEWDKLLLDVRYQPLWPLPYRTTAHLSLDVSCVNRSTVARLVDVQVEKSKIASAFSLLA